MKKTNIQNDSNNDDSSEKNDKKDVNKIILIEEKTKIKNNLLEVINAFKKCCNI